MGDQKVSIGEYAQERAMNPGIDALTDVVGLGLLADDAVLGTSRALRGEELPAHQRRALERAERLLRSLARPPDPANESPYNNEQLRELVSSQARAVSVARRQRPSLELESYFSNLLELLEEARKPGASDGGEEHFEELLDFFERLGQASLSGAHEEATAIGMPAWMSPSPTGVF
jgi:hypothetical protein